MQYACRTCHKDFVILDTDAYTIELAKHNEAIECYDCCETLVDSMKKLADYVKDNSKDISPEDLAELAKIGQALAELGETIKNLENQDA